LALCVTGLVAVRQAYAAVPGYPDHLLDVLGAKYRAY
jgi:hypothetical protein